MRLPLTTLTTAICLVVAAIAPSLQARERTCPAARDFRAVTYNVRLDTPADGENRWERRKHLLTGQLELLKPDIVGLQEVLPGQGRDIEQALPGYQRIGGGRDDGAGKGEAAPLLVARNRFAVRESGLFWLSPTPDRPSRGWDAAYPRIATWARLTDQRSGLRLLAINTHWDHEGRQARLEGARQLVRWIAANQQQGEAVLMLGDFNAPIDEPSLQALLASPVPGLGDSRTLAGANAGGATASFNAFNPQPPIQPAIDHILPGRELRVQRHHVLAEQFDGRVASDHFPVIVDLAPAGRCR